MAEAWPDWPVLSDNPAKHARDLARYVDITQTWRLVPEDCYASWSKRTMGEVRRALGKERAVRLYNELLARRIPYSHEPWNPVSFGPREMARYGSDGLLQRVRGPNETIQGPATCLDLSLVFAGMALSADMRPFIALRTTSRRHVLVVLNIKAPRSELAEYDIDLDGFTERANEPGIWDLADPRGLSFGGANEWLVVDVFRAAGLPGQAGGSLEVGWPAEDAVRHELDPADESWTLPQWTLVDVDRVRKTPLEPYAPPIGPSVPAIYGYLPTFHSFIDYPTRRSLLHEMHGLVGPTLPPAIIVLHGEPGRGKSMLASRLAIAADRGCGWFLSATDDKVLIRSLARAENEERGKRDSGEGADAIEDRALASAALSRLRETDHPWVVVLDNCDSSPSLAALRELIPRPRAAGQFVIITTKNQDWRGHGENSGWTVRELPALEQRDLAILDLPAGTDGAVYGTPLIAQALAALHKQAGVTLPQNTGDDGPGLVWNLLRMSEYRWPAVGETARLLAWCPPEPIDARILGQIADHQQGAEAGRRLAELSFVTPSFTDGQLAIQMHRLFAAAVRQQTWRDAPVMATDIISGLLGDDAGRRIFIEAPDSEALGRLEREGAPGEPGDVARAATTLANQAKVGLLWHSLGHIRERRGPVVASGPHFEQALRYLDRGTYPSAAAESLIGQARVVFQNGQSSPDQLADARELIATARDLLLPLEDLDARQLREQGNALSWLIARKLAGRERNPRTRESKLTEVADQLWLSYEERLRLIRGVNPDAIGRDTLPGYDDGIGAERAYYNLAGTYIDLAKVHYDLALAEDPASERHQKLLSQVSADLEQARIVYQHVRRLREKRYRGQPHPHLAACVQGEAIVAYYRAVLLGDHKRLIDSFELATEAMRQRQVVAGGLATPGSLAILRDGDVRKSGEFMLKVAIAMQFATSARPTAGADATMGILREAMTESLGRVRWPSQEELTGVTDGGN